MVAAGESIKAGKPVEDKLSNANYESDQSRSWPELPY
jgi:hypothetical protein